MHEHPRQASREARKTINALSALGNWTEMTMLEIVKSHGKRIGKEMRLYPNREPYLMPCVSIREHHIKISVHKDPIKHPDDPHTQLHMAIFFVCLVCEVYTSLSEMPDIWLNINPVSKIDTCDPYVQVAQYILSQLKNK